MYLSERLNRNVSVMARHIRLCKIDTSPTYPFRYHCYFGHRIAYERVQDALLPSFASHWGLYIVNIIISHYKEDLQATRQISRSLFETGISGFFIRLFLRRFANRLLWWQGLSSAAPLSPSGLLAISPMARLSKK